MSYRDHYDPPDQHPNFAVITFESKTWECFLSCIQGEIEQKDIPDIVRRKIQNFTDELDLICDNIVKRKRILAEKRKRWRVIEGK